MIARSAAKGSMGACLSVLICATAGVLSSAAAGLGPRSLAPGAATDELVNPRC
jgi:hypothetical protein